MDDLPRYTWTEDRRHWRLVIYEDKGIRGQYELMSISYPPLRELRPIHKEAATALCEWLSERDRQRREQG